MGIFKKPSRPVVPSVSDEEVEEARDRQRRARVLAQGRQSTILTGAQGVGTSPGATRPTLLAGG